MRRRNGFVNIAECNVILTIASAWVEKCATRLPDNEIAILTPYREQVLLLNDEIERKHENLRGLVDVMTIEASQGKEFGAVFISLVRTKPSTSGLPFLDVDNMANVAISRAKGFLVIVSQAPAIAQNAEAWRKVFSEIWTSANSPDNGEGVAYCTLSSRSGLAGSSDMNETHGYTFANVVNLPTTFTRST